MNKHWMLIARITGAVSLTFGMVSAALAVWAVDRQFAIRGIVQVSAAAAVLTFVAVAVFCCLAGYRRLFNRPNRHGLLLSRAAWRMLALSYCAIALIVVAIASGRGNHGLFAFALVLGLLALGSMIAARSISLKGAFSPVFPAGTSLLQTPGHVPAGFSCGIEIMNDNTTPMEFVISVLQSCLGISRSEAIRWMLEIHRKGGALFPLASFEEATRIAQAVTEEARALNHPLTCRAVRVE